MTGEIQVVDPGEMAPTDPVRGLRVRTPFHVGDYELELLRVRGGDTAWHARGGAVYGWVRDGRGYVEYGLREEHSAPLHAGDFVRIPADVVHRYRVASQPLELLAVVEEGSQAGEAELQPDAEATVDVVGPDQLVPTVETPALTRETPFPDEDVLVMRVEATGGAAAGWHHHDQNVYYGYAVDGPSETEYGPDGEQVARIERGECFHVPPGLVHRDTNPTDEAHTGIIWLCGGEPWVVNVGGPE